MTYRNLFSAICLLASTVVASPVMAAYAPGTIITPNALEPAKRIMVLENSIVDLFRGVEILDFNYTFGKSVCDVYKGLTGNVLSNKSSCNNLNTVYTPAVLSAQDGWRIGHSSDLMEMVRLFGGWQQGVWWLTSFRDTSTMQFIDETLGRTRLSSGQASFIVSTSDKIPATGMYSNEVTTIDLMYGSGGVSYRTGSGGSYGAITNDRSVLMVRDWLGEERAINSAALPVNPWVLSLIGFMAIGLRRKAV